MENQVEIIPHSAIGMFNFGDSFFEAGQTLMKINKPRHGTHPDSPVEFLHWHAIELFLKAFLLADGVSGDELRKPPFGHDIQKLACEARKRGLEPTDRDLAVMSFMPTASAMIETRYLTIGFKTQPLMEEVEATCRSLHLLVSNALRSRGIATPLSA